MKPIVQQGYGAPNDVLKLAEVDTPAVGDQEVLVRVRASSANPWDWHFIRGEPVLMRPAGIGGIRKPKFLIPGGDLAGTVEQVGGRVTGFAPGDHVNEHIWRDAVDGRRPAGAPAAKVGAPARGSGGRDRGTGKR